MDILSALGQDEGYFSLASTVSFTHTLSMLNQSIDGCIDQLLRDVLVYIKLSYNPIVFLSLSLHPSLRGSSQSIDHIQVI